MQTQSKESVQQSRQSQQRISNQMQQNKQNQSRKPQTNQDDAEIKEKLKAMLTQVQRGESAPRVTGNYPQGLKPSSSSQQNHGRNNRYAGSSVNRVAQQQYGQILPRRQDFVFGRSQRPHGLLGPQPEHVRGRKTLVLDLDETLVHSQFNQVRNPDYTIPVDIEGRVSNIYVMKRPGAEYFLQQMAQHFEVVIYTASLSKYADPLMNMMDPQGYSLGRLFREHCTFVNGVFVKDMAQIGRNMKDAIIIDNSPTSYMLQPECGMPIISWYDDPNDRALFDYIPVLIEMAKINDMREAITGFVRNNTFTSSNAMKVIAQIRERENQEVQKRQEDLNRKQLQLQAQAQAQQQQEMVKQKQDQPQQLLQKLEASNTEDTQDMGNKTNALGPVQEVGDGATQSKMPSQQQVKKKPLINSWFAKQNQGQTATIDDKQANPASPNQTVDPSQQQVRSQRIQQQIQEQRQQKSQGRVPNQANNLANVPQSATNAAAPQLLINTNSELAAGTSQMKQHRRNKSNFNPNDPNRSLKLDQQQTNAQLNATTSSQQKVTNITNIIYNFNYGTPQAQNQANAQQPSLIANGQQPNGGAGAEAGTATDLEKVPSRQGSLNSQQQQPPQSKISAHNRKIKVDPPALQINVSGTQELAKENFSKRATPKQNSQNQGSIDDEDGNNLSNRHKKRPNTGSGNNNQQQLRQSFKRNHQSSNPGSAAVLKPKDQIAQSTTMPGQSNGMALYAGQSENQIGKVVKMSRKSTIDQKDANMGKMVVVLEKNRAGSQKKQEFAQSFTPSSNNQNVMKHHIPGPQMQHNKVLQVSVNGAKSLKSKLKQNNPFYTGPSPKVLPIEIGNRGQLFNQIKTPQSALMGNMSIQKNFNQEKNRAIKAFTPSAAGSELRYQNSGDQPTQSIFNFNQSPTAASQNSQSVMLTTPQNGSLKNSHVAKGGFNSTTNATSPLNSGNERQGNSKRQVSNKVRSFSQNQGSRKGGINNILVYNQQQLQQNQPGLSPSSQAHNRNQNSVLNTHQQQYSLQLQGMHQGSVQVGTRSTQNANGQSQILYTDQNTKLDTSGIRHDKQNHSALVEKYSSFLTKSKVGTPSGGDLNMQRAQQQRVSQGNASQIINKLRNSQNQALSSHKSGSQNGNYARNLLIIPQNSVIQAPNAGPKGYMAISPKTQMPGGGSRGGSREKYGQPKPGNGNSYSQQQQLQQQSNVSRNQRVITVSNSDKHKKEGSLDLNPSPKMQDGGILAGSQQLSFQIGQGKPTSHGGKISPKNNNLGTASYITKQNPFKGATAAAASDMHGSGMQQHAQFVNQPHHLVMPGHNIMAVSGPEHDGSLNLQNLYPQSQSPMSFKQMQKAKRQKRANNSFVGNNAGNNVPAMQSSVNNNRHSGNGSQMNQNPLHQFYAATQNQSSRQ